MKVVLYVLALFVFITYAQESSAESVSEPALLSDDEELILDDDEDIQKASKQDDAAVSKQNQSEPARTASPLETEKKTDDGELKLDGGEENILDAVKPVVTKSGSGVKDSTISADSATQSASVDSSVAGQAETVNLNVEQSKTESVFVKKNADPQNIGATGSINFARNLKDYRSPKVAMLMSLLVPGTGQVYAAHHSWKAAIYGAVEVGMIATGVAINLKGKKGLKDAHKFADQHYSFQKYLDYQNALINNVDSTRYKEEIFPFRSDSLFYENAVLRNEDYYSDLKEGVSPYVNGWDDAKPGFDENLIPVDPEYNSLQDTSYLVFKGTDSLHVAYGFSDNQKKYQSKVSKADDYFKKSSLVLTLMLVNHIVSAIDAGFSAKAHNDRLLNKQTVWQHIGLEQICVSDGGRMAPGYALKVRF